MFKRVDGEKRVLVQDESVSWLMESIVHMAI